MSSLHLANSTHFEPNMLTCSHVSDMCPVSATLYGYAPNLGGNVFFAVMHGLMLIIQTGYVIYFRAWTFYIAMLGSTLLELVGYIGRVMMHFNAWNERAFEAQMICLILGPSFNAAGIYLVMKHFVVALGRQHSRLKAELFSWIFILADVCSLLLQGGGGGIESGAGSKSGSDVIQLGNNIIIAGIALQIGVMAICGLYALDFFYRYSKSTRGNNSGQNVTTELQLMRNHLDEENSNSREMLYPAASASPAKHGEGDIRFSEVKWMFVAEVVAYVTVLIRCIYRLPEMSGGWGGPLMKEENPFLILDGMMIVIAVLAFTVCHPGMFFPAMRTGKKQQ